MSKVIEFKNATLIEQNCVFDFEGKKFESGGTWIGINVKTNKREGILYAYPQEGKIGTWGGSKKVYAFFGSEWYSNFGDKRQYVHFFWNDIPFAGTYYKSSGDIVKVKQVKS